MMDLAKTGAVVARLNRAIQNTRDEATKNDLREIVSLLQSPSATKRDAELLALANRVKDIGAALPSAFDRAFESDRHLIAALDKSQAASAGAEEQSALEAAEEALDRIQEEQNAVCERMLDIKPATLRGLQALATALVFGPWSGRIERLPSPTTEDRMIAAIVRALSDPSPA